MITDTTIFKKKLKAYFYPNINRGRYVPECVPDTRCRGKGSASHAAKPQATRQSRGLGEAACGKAASCHGKAASNLVNRHSSFCSQYCNASLDFIL